MAKQTLPVNFKDDILDPSMSGKRKYRLIDNGDGTVSFEDVTTYTQTGSDFGAGQINATNQAVNESCDKANVIDNLDDIVANQASGMIAGAKAVVELNGNLSGIGQVAEVGNYGTWNLPTSDYYAIGNKMSVINNAYYQTSMENSIITIKQSGVYLITFNAQCSISSDRGTVWTRITKNNAELASMQNNGNTGYIGVAYSKIARMDAGDKINAFMSATGTIQSTGEDSLSIMRVSA